MPSSRLYTLLAVLSFWGCQTTSENANGDQQLPNIIYILADDMGYGDVSALNKEAKIRTQFLDSIASQGIHFTDAHSPSSVCTPTRYGLLTGRYAWRSKLKAGVTWSYDSLLIDKNRSTVADLLKQHDYFTACVGKWHLGLDWARTANGAIDFSQPISGGPNEVGFDYFYGITASLDIPPYFYIENDRITATAIDSIEGNDLQGPEFWRKGPIGNDFKHVEVLPKLTEKAIDVIAEQSKTDAPFFLYFPLPAPHTPILPTDEFKGKTGTNLYGDFVLMVDDVVGQILQAVDDNQIADNTLIIFTSDNGCSPRANFKELALKGHFPSYQFRGHKADIFEGGHRVPFLARWPRKIRSGMISKETMCLTDLMRTCAAIVGDTLTDQVAEDSYNMLAPLTGASYQGPIREATVHHSVNGSFAIRKDNWKLEFCPGSGGWSFPTPDKAKSLPLPPIQLYDLELDIAERKNLAEVQPEKVAELSQLMNQYIRNGRSTPGSPQKNTGVVQFVQEDYKEIYKNAQ